MSLTSLHRLSLLIGSSLQRERECAAFMDWIRSEVEPRRAALFVAAPGRESLIPAAVSGFRKPPRGVLPAGHDPWSWLEAQKLSLPRGERYALPILLEGELFGLLAVISAQKGEALSEEQRLLDLALAYLAPILRNIEHYENVERTVEERTAQLRQSEERWQFISQATYEGIVVHEQGTIVDVNETGARMVGYTREELIGKSILIFTHPDSVETVLKNVSRGGELPIEAIGLRKDGTTFYCELRGRNLIFQGRPVRAVVVRDITERKMAETRLRSVVEQVPLVTYTESSQDGRTIFISPQIQALSGYTPEEWINDPNLWKKVLHPDDRSRVIAEDDRTNQNGEPFRVEYRLVARSGEIRWVREEAVLIRDEGGAPLYWQGFKLDITERKQAEEALRESENLLQESQRIAGLGSYVLDILTGVWVSSEVLDKVFGIDKTYERTVAGWAALTHPDDRQMMVEYFTQEVLGRGQPFDKEYRIIRRSDGAERWVHGLGKLEFDSSGRPVKMHGTIQDITARKQAEEALHESETRYQKISEMISDYAYAFRVEADNQLVREWVTESFARITGYTSAETDERGGWPSLIHPEDMPIALARAKRLFAGQPDTSEFRIVRKDGAIRWLRDYGYPVWDDAQGRVVRIYGAAEDITERKHHERQLEAQAMLARALGESLELQPLLERLLEAARHAIPAAEKGSISLMEADGKHLQVRTVSGYQDDSVLNFVYPLNWGYAGRAARERQPLLVKDVQADQPLQADAKNAPMREVGELRSAIAVPLFIQERVIGVLSLDSTRKDAFTQEDLNHLVGFAASAALVIENARLFERTRQHAENLRAIQIMGRGLAETFDLAAIYEQVRQSILALLPEISGVMINLFDSEKQLITPAYCYTDDAVQDVSAIPPIPLAPPGEGTQSRAIRSRQPVVINHFQEQLKKARVHVTVGQAGPPRRSSMYVPMLTQGKVVGLIVVQSPVEERFSDADVELTSLIANTAAVAIENARLFEETRRRAEETASLLNASLSLSSLDLQETLHTIGQRARHLFAADGCRIFLLEPDGNTLRCVLALAESETAFADLRINLGQGVTGHVALTGQAEIVNDMLNDPRAQTVPGTEEEPEALIFAPLKSGEKTIGVISIRRVGSERPFQPNDLDLLQAFASLAASAVSNARLFEEVQARLQELEILQTLSTSLRQARAVEEMLPLFIQYAAQSVNAAAGSIYLWEEASGEWVSHGWMTADGRWQTDTADLRHRPGQGVTGWVGERGEIYVTTDWRADPTNQPLPHELEFIESLTSGISLPLKAESRVIGVLHLWYVERHDFSGEEKRLLTAIADMAGNAIQRARLFEQTQRHVTELATINRISIALRAITKKDEMLAVVLEETLAALNAANGSINLLNPASGKLDRFIARGWLSEFTEKPIQPGEGIFGTVFSSRNIHISRDFAHDPLTLPEARGQLPVGWGGACVPISSATETLGVMLIAVPGSRELSRDEIRLLNTLAEMTGNALHRMELHDETIRRAEEFAALYETNKAITVEYELNALLQTIVRGATDLLHATGGGMYLYDPLTGEMEMAVATHPSIPVGTRLQIGEGVAGRVAQTRQPLRIDDYARWDGRSQKYANAPIRAVLEVPILFGGELIGILVAHEVGDSDRTFTDSDERLLSLFAAQAAGAIRSARLHEETEQRLRNLQALREVDRVITSSFDLRPILNAVVGHIISELGVDAADILLLNPALQTLEYAAGFGFRTRAIERSSARLGQGHAGMAALSHQIVHVPSLPESGPEFRRASLLSSENFIEYFGVPLITKGEVKGVLEIFNRSPLRPKREWIELLETLAGQAAIAIDNSQLFEKIQHSNMELTLAYEATIEGWSRAMDLRDEETEGHTLRVTEKTLTLARSFNLSDEEILHIRRGALLHDIGKIGVPDNILLKPGPLTGQEWEIMRKHPLFAYQMLHPIHHLRSSIDIPYLHHEKWDGTGYPLGLKGEQIPLAARIFAIVDVYDALTSDRPYRKAWSEEDALNYIREQSGKHFDPEVVEKFLQLFGGGQR
jgi:PAS domain S-box-containing protein